MISQMCIIPHFRTFSYFYKADIWSFGYVEGILKPHIFAKSKIGSKDKHKLYSFDQVVHVCGRTLFSQTNSSSFSFDMGYVFPHTYSFPFFYIHACACGMPSLGRCIFFPCLLWIMDLFSHGTPFWCTSFILSIFVQPIFLEILERVTFGYIEWMVNVYVYLIIGV